MTTTRELGAPTSLGIKLVPALSLTGEVGATYQVEYADALAATNVWTPLDSRTLPNSPQLYFDSSAVGQPARYYRLRQVQ